MRRSLNYIAGAFCGALVGSVLALLLTPDSGENLRNRFRQRTKHFRDEVREAYGARVAQLETELENLRTSPSKKTNE